MNGEINTDELPEPMVVKMFTLAIYYNGVAEEFRSVLTSHDEDGDHHNMVANLTLGGTFDRAKSSAMKRHNEREAMEPKTPSIIVPPQFLNGSN